MIEKLKNSDIENCSIKIIVESHNEKYSFQDDFNDTFTHFVVVHTVHTLNFTSKKIMTYLLSSHCISFFTVKNAVTRKMG